MELHYHGHSCIQLSDGEHSLIIDPFITGNPASPTNPDNIKVNHVLLTHAHPDHISNADSITRQNDAVLIAIYELATHFGWKGLQTVGMNMGGTVNLGYATAKMVPAFHSSGMFLEEEQQIKYMGMPAGFVIRWNGLTIYHSGDTSLFSDMKLIGEQHDIDLALLPIGDVFTMGPDDALLAAEWLRAKAVIPIHHSTWPPIAQDAKLFAARLAEKGIQGIPLAPGETHQLK